jgi:hypothetical protein
MRAHPETIRLGAREWLIRPLTIAQVQAIEPLLMPSGASPSRSVAAAIGILRVALARDHAEAAANLEDYEAGASDIAAAMACVLRLGGFLPVMEPRSAAPGEAGAGETPASSTTPGWIGAEPTRG